MGHDVCETIGGSVTVYADFIDGVDYPFTVCVQCKVMPATKSTEAVVSLSNNYCVFILLVFG